MRTPTLTLLWILSIGLLVWSSLMPRLAPPGDYHLDKLAHLVVYAMLAGPAAFLLHRRAAVLGAGLLLVLVGLGIELAQDLVPGRRGSGEDALVNVLGVVLGLATGLALRRVWRSSYRP